MQIRRHPFPRALILLLLTAACSAERKSAPVAGYEVTELRYLSSLGNVTFAELGEELGYLAPLKLKWVGTVLGGPEAIQAVSTGDIDFGTAATGSVIKVIAAGAPLKQVIAGSGIDDLTWGGYFVLEDSPLRSARDLIGKKIGVNTLGAHAEFMIREYLRRGGLSLQEIKDVTMVVTPAINSEQTLRQRHIDVASLSGVFRDRARERGGLRPLFSDLGLFGHFNSTTVVFNREALAKRPNAVRKFVESTARAIEWARSTPQAEVRERMAALLAKRGRGEDPTLSRHWHSVGISSRGGLLSDRDMQIWVDWLAREGYLDASKVGKLSALYTNDFNAYRDVAARAER